MVCNFGLSECNRVTNIFLKGNNFHDFLIVFLDSKALLIFTVLLKERKEKERIFFIFRQRTSSGNVPIRLNTALRMAKAMEFCPF